jgi:acetyl-CoA carboxylase biotin carboxyl carrier protein
MSDKPHVDKELIRELAGLLDETGLTEIEVENGKHRIRIARAPAVAAVPVGAPVGTPVGALPAASTAPAVAELANHPGALLSPMVGTAFIAPELDTPPFVSIGDQVSVGQTLLIVEAMKTMNPIPAPKAGKVTQILISDGAPVEYGEVLMIIE